MLVTMKKNIDKSFWLEPMPKKGFWEMLKHHMVDNGFITITINPANGKEYWKTTPKGIKAYKTVLELTDENKA